MLSDEQMSKCADALGSRVSLIKEGTAVEQKEAQALRERAGVGDSGVNSACVMGHVHTRAPTF